MGLVVKHVWEILHAPSWKFAVHISNLKALRGHAVKKPVYFLYLGCLIIISSQYLFLA